MIDKIGYSKPVSTARIEAKRRASSASGTQFADMLDAVGEIESADPLTATAPVAGAGALLGLQEVSEEEIRRKRALKQGKTTLDVLEHLRDAVLAGNVSPTNIRQLEKLVAEQRAESTDPQLDGILDEIEVRVAVELAKLERASREQQ